MNVCPECGGAVAYGPDSPCLNPSCMNSERGRADAPRKMHVTVEKESGLLVSEDAKPVDYGMNRAQRRDLKRRQRKKGKPSKKGRRR